MALPMAVRAGILGCRFHAVPRLNKAIQSVVNTIHCSGQSPESDDLVVSERIGHVYMIGINRPKVRNCVDLPTGELLHQEFGKFEKDDDLWVAVLYGKGGCFCGGFDLKALSTMDSVELEKDTSNSGGMGLMGPTKMSFSKPVIAAVSGYAVAGGMELAMMCDLRIMEDTATMGVFCRRWGVPLLDGGTVRLQKLVGFSRAMDMILTGRPITAKEAGEAGLANRVVPQGTAVGEAVKLAQTLCLHPQECLRADRRSAYHAAYDSPSLKEALTYEWNNGIRVVAEESVKGAQRFNDGAGRHGQFEKVPEDSEIPKHKL